MEVNNKTAPVTGQQDQNTISLDLMNRMKLHGMLPNSAPFARLRLPSSRR